MSVEVLTPRQRLVLEAVERTGTIGRAALDLGISEQSVGATYKRAMDRLADPMSVVRVRVHGTPRLTYREQMAAVGPRLAAVEEKLESLLIAGAADSALIAKLAVEIREWTSRQPVFVEVRPRHARRADGGGGGVRETRDLRRALTSGERS